MSRSEPRANPARWQWRCGRAVMLSKAFRDIVFSQVRISALNTMLTAIYLVVVLPGSASTCLSSGR